jgi:hypothetical protein
LQLTPYQCLSWSGRWDCQEDERVFFLSWASFNAMMRCGSNHWRSISRSAPLRSNPNSLFHFYLPFLWSSLYSVYLRPFTPHSSTNHLTSCLCPTPKCPAGTLDHWKYQRVFPEGRHAFPGRKPISQSGLLFLKPADGMFTRPYPYQHEVVGFMYLFARVEGEKSPRSS